MRLSASSCVLEAIEDRFILDECNLDTCCLIMVTCVIWSSRFLGASLKLLYGSRNFWSCYHPTQQCRGVVTEAHSTTISFDASIYLLMGLVNGYGGKHPLSLLDSEVTCSEFLVYLRVCPWEFSHVSQVNLHGPLHETIWLVLLAHQGTWEKMPLAMTAQRPA